MPNCEFVTFISILACNIAKDTSPEELAILSAFFVQLRRYFSHSCSFSKAFGNDGVSYFQIVPAQAILLLIMTFIPTPSSGGGTEGGFLLIFNTIF